ncbi:MAG: glycoside hydrolase family 2 protein [Hyphomicrobiales bacterium]|nr:glycoside hydrolase family 2 protein [Hyphomicrobiales bacterium]
MTVLPLTQWRLVRTPPGAAATPDQLSRDLPSIPAQAPGTVASALLAQNAFDPALPENLDGDDFWYRATVDAHGPHRLVCEGLATIAEIFLDERLVATSQSMFVPLEAMLDLRGHHDLHICFRALGPLLEAKGPRAKWRPRMVSPQTLRLWRTTFLGRMPGWCPPVHAVGPFRAIELHPADEPFRLISCRTNYADDCGQLSVIVESQGREVRLACDGREIALQQDSDRYTGTLDLPGIAPWWPHTHGDPRLHEVSLNIDGVAFSLGRTGFRKIEIDRGADGGGFGLRVNDVAVFCRGACWTSADIVSLGGTRAQYEPLLTHARDAHMNMIRVGGTMLYETNAFHELCDELGILVWQDFMLANFDYPAADSDWCELLRAEADAFLWRTQMSPSLAVLCGGSEVFQQAAMMGVAAAKWSSPVFDELLASAVSRCRADVPYVPNTPFGGAPPFEPRTGVTHYYGVSAYMRPLSDARDAQVRFAAECLGFAHVPENDVELEDGRGAVVQPCWGERVPGDVGAVWFFEQVRNHYLQALYGVDPDQLRLDDPTRYLDLSRATTVEIVENVFNSWRRHGSQTRGGLVWFLRDVTPGAGWGVLDFSGAPKPVWHGLARAYRPLQVLLCDEGLNGLDVHVVNDGAETRPVEITLTCLRDGALPVMQATRRLELAPHSTSALPATDLWGAFFDTAYAYRFGPPSHDVTCAVMRDARNGDILSEAFHFPLGRGHAQADLGLAAELVQDDHGWSLHVSTRVFAQSVHVNDANYRALDHWRHLAPGAPRIIRLIPREGACETPQGKVSAVNGLDVAFYGARP